MGHSLFQQAGSYDSGTFKVLCDAFDQAWEEIAGMHTSMPIEEKRTRLALIILDLANQGEREVEDLKDTAIEFMRLEARPATLKSPDV